MTDITITEDSDEQVVVSVDSSNTISITEDSDDSIQITEASAEQINITESAAESISLTVGVSEERVEDLVAALLTAGALISLSYDDDAGTLTISAEVEASAVDADTDGFDTYLSAADDTVQKALDTLDDLVPVADTTNFDGKLSATDDTVQKALDTLDDITTFSLAVDTKANILDTSPSVNVLAFAPDTTEFYVYDGSDWNLTDDVTRRYSLMLGG